MGRQLRSTSSVSRAGSMGVPTPGRSGRQPGNRRSRPSGHTSGRTVRAKQRWSNVKYREMMDRAMDVYFDPAQLTFNSRELQDGGDGVDD